MRTAIVTAIALALCTGPAVAQPAPAVSPSASKKPANTATKGPVGRAVKETPDSGMAECMRLWDAQTHMSKQEWSRTCQRIQSRLENLKVDNGPSPKKGRK